MASPDDVRAQQRTVRDLQTNVAVSVEALKAQLSQAELTDWYALSGAALTFVSADVPVLFGVDDMAAQGRKLLSSLNFWADKVSGLGAPPAQTDWGKVPHVAPPPGPGLLDQARSALTGPVGLALIAYFLLTRKRG